MHVVDLVPRSEVANGLQHVHTHLGDGALAEVQSIRVARDDVQKTLQTFDGPEHAGLALQRRHGRIVRVAGQPDARALGHGYHVLDEVGDPVPDLFLGGLPLRHGLRLEGLVVVEVTDGCAATGGVPPGGPEYGGEVEHVLDDGDVLLAEDLERPVDVLDFLLPSGTSQSDVPVLGPGRLGQKEDFDLQPVGLDLLLGRQQLFPLKRPSLVLVQEIAAIHFEMGYPQLGRELQAFIRQIRSGGEFHVGCAPWHMVRVKVCMGFEQALCDRISRDNRVRSCSM